MVWPVVYLLALAALQVPAREIISASYERHPVQDSGMSRIVSGWDAVPGQFPYQAQLRLVSALGSLGNCGGSIIHKEWILTAAHCTANRVQIIARAGITYFSSPDVSIDSTEYYMYPTFNPAQATTVQINDVALVKLPQALSYNQYVQSIRIQPPADTYRNYQNELTYASGFGLTMTDGERPEILQWVYLRGVSNLDCSRVYGTTLVTANTICAQNFNQTSQSICNGDSGGPLVHESPDGVPILIGISSFVPGKPQGCHSGFPAAFMRPAPFYDWYEQITGIDFRNLDESDEWKSTEAPSTEAPSTEAPTTDAPSTEAPSTEAPSTTAPSTPEPTTVKPPTTIPEPEEEDEEKDEEREEEEEEEEDGDEEDQEDDDKELSELLKKLEIDVKVKVKLNKYGQKKKIKIDKKEKSILP